MKGIAKYCTLVTLMFSLALLSGVLSGCSGNDGLQPLASQQATYKTVTFNGSLDYKTTAKTAYASAGSVGSVSVIDASTGKAISQSPTDITSTYQFSGLTVNLPAPKTVLVLVAALNSGATFRTIIPFDLSNPPTGLTQNNALNIVVGPSSDAVTVAVSKSLGVTGTLGDSGVSLPAGKDHATVAASVMSNGGGTVSFGAAGITVNGSIDAVAVSKPLTVTIAHLNDTHSQLEPTAATFKLPSTSTFTNTQVMLGGVTRFKTAIDDLRSKEQNVLLLHAGDAVQGTLYFTQYQGVADYDFLNLLRVDALTLGNHEFDKGTKLTASLVKQANFPVISANLDVSGDANMKGLISPYTIKSFGTERVGIIGLALPSTPDISSPGPNVKFNDPTTSVVATVAQLKAQGINKIIVLSHMGYSDDVKLAKAVNGIGVIIGGHSHTMMGGTDFKGTGLSYTPAGGVYPTEVTNPSGKKVLVAQAWEWFKILGTLKVTFDADGTVQSFENKEKIIVSDVIAQKSASTDTTYAALQPGSDAYKAVVASLPSAAQVLAEDPTASTMLSAYKSPIQTLMTTKIATAANDIKRGNDVGPGPIFADAMVWKLQNMNPKPTIAFQNAGGVRADILTGDVTVGTVYTVFPFGNTLVVMDLTGAQVQSAIEDGVGYQLDSYTPPRNPPYMYVSGIKYTVTRANAKGSRISNVMVKDATGAFVALDAAKTYRVVSNNFMAGGGDGYATFKNTTGYKYDTGINDAESFLDYLKQVPGGTISNPTATLITVASAKIIELKKFIARRSGEIERFISGKLRKAA